MTIVEEEQVEHTVETKRVTTTYCDVCGGVVEDEVETFEVSGETKHAHEDCLSEAFGAEPERGSPSVVEDTELDESGDGGWFAGVSVVPPVIGGFASLLREFGGRVVRDGPEQVGELVSRGVEVSVVGVLLLSWPITGLWLAGRDSVRGNKLDGDSVLRRYSIRFAPSSLVWILTLMTFGYVYFSLFVHPAFWVFAVLSGVMTFGILNKLVEEGW